MRNQRYECSSTEMEVEPFTPKERLRSIWNCNGWNVDEGQKIADLVAMEGASILGITDVRIKGNGNGGKFIHPSLLP